MLRWGGGGGILFNALLNGKTGGNVNFSGTGGKQKSEGNSSKIYKREEKLLINAINIL